MSESSVHGEMKTDERVADRWREEHQLHSNEGEHLVAAGLDRPGGGHVR